jgi:membrane protein implicated in regulation of membrane protease activity
MELWLLWVVAGFALVISELLTGTFYLLVIGVGAFAAALAAWLGADILIQAVVASAVALGGAWAVHHWHLANRKGEQDRGNLLDRGQPVVLEGWSNESAGMARVKYRGTSWDARFSQEGRPVPGSTLYIDAMDGNTLVVVAAPPTK